MKKTIKLIAKMFKSNKIYFDGIFYSVITDNKAIIIRPIGKMLIIEKKIVIA